MRHKKFRKHPKLVLGALSLLAFALSASAVAGVGHGGGGLDPSEAQNPWFLGDAPIEYCVTVAADFPVSKTQVQAHIREAFAEWKKTFGKYGFRGQPFTGRFFDGVKRGLTVDAQEVPVCDQPEHQLEFKIGVLDARVNRYIAKNSKRVVGFADRNAYDHRSFRTGGYIWISPHNFGGPFVSPLPERGPDGQITHPTVPIFPDWQKNTWLQSVITHEIGHVFGFPHVPGTVMDGDIYSRLEWEHIYCRPSSCAPSTIGPKIEAGKVRIDPFVGNAEIPMYASGAAFLAKAAGYEKASTANTTGTASFQRAQLSKDQKDVVPAQVHWTINTPDLTPLKISANLNEFGTGGGRLEWTFYSPSYEQEKGKGLGTNHEPLLMVPNYGSVWNGSVSLRNQIIPFVLRFDKDLTLEFMRPTGKWTEGSN